MLKKYLLIALIVACCIFGYNYIYQDHRDIHSEKADFTISSNSIALEFFSDPNASEQKYLNKTVAILGDVSELNNSNLTLNNKIFCLFNKDINQSIGINLKTKIKGRIIGYDDLLEQIKMDQCIVLTN